VALDPGKQVGVNQECSLTWETPLVKYHPGVSPTILRTAGFRFYFFSREELRVHVHVQSPRGEAKIWIEPEIELAQDHGLGRVHAAQAVRLVREHEKEIRQAWKKHFAG
jgi:hypothetical protein